MDSTFSRSRSSSISSLENKTAEAVTYLAFVDSYTKKSGKNGIIQKIELWIYNKKRVWPHLDSAGYS